MKNIVNSISQILASSGQKLKKISPRPAVEAEILLAKVLNQPQAWILAHGDKSINNYQLSIINSLIERRSKGEPLAYVLGEQEFYGLNFKVNKHVLIPRPETEMMVDTVCHCEEEFRLLSERRRGNLKSTQKNKIATSASTPPRNDIIVDVGTGSGAIVVSIAKNIKNIRQRPASAYGRRTSQRLEIFAIDISAEALKVAKQNAKLNGVDKDITFLKGNLLEPLLSSRRRRDRFNMTTSLKGFFSPLRSAQNDSQRGNLNSTQKIRGRHASLTVIRESCDDRLVIVANLPYLKTNLPGLTKAQKKDLGFEPRLALLAGIDGLKYYRQLAKQIQTLKKSYPNLAIELLAEIDPDQVKPMKRLFSDAKKIEVKKDFRQLNRLMIFEL